MENFPSDLNLLFHCSRLNGSPIQSITSPQRHVSLVSSKSNGSPSVYYYYTNNRQGSMNNNGQHQSAALASATRRKLQARSADNLLLWNMANKMRIRTCNKEWSVISCFLVRLTEKLFARWVEKALFAQFYAQLCRKLHSNQRLLCFSESRLKSSWLNQYQRKQLEENKYQTAIKHETMSCGT